VVRRLRFSGPKTSIICSPMTSLKTSIKTITYLSDIGCLEIQGASLKCLNQNYSKYRLIAIFPSKITKSWCIDIINHQ
ncbi:hypothetical protein, partial [Escherichia coli]|uniref:hypothetical protein n=1 Tax=Escherichia coli TaxID=562 RepID=UPI003CCC7894